MALDKEWLDEMRHTVQIAAFAGRSGDGKPTFAAPATSWPAMVVQKNERVRNAQGQEVVSGTQVYMGGVSGVTTIDQLTLPDGSTPEILAVEKFPDDEGGFLFEVIYCGTRRVAA